MILKALFLHPLGPALFLSLGGIVLAVLRRVTRREAVLAQVIAGRPVNQMQKTSIAGLRLPIALLTVLAAAALLVYLRMLSPRPVLGWTWQPLTVAGSMLEWQLDLWSWVVSALVIGLTGVSLLLGNNLLGASEPARLDLVGTDVERTLFLSASVLVFVASSNILTLASTWLVLDAALAIRLHVAPTSGTSARAWGALSLTGILLLLLLALLGEDGIRANLITRRLNDLELTLLWLAALIRAGVYPFHFWLTGASVTRRDHWLPMYVIAPIAGLWLLGRVHALAGEGWLRRPEWIALGALALLGTALVAWLVDDRQQRWRWISLNRTGLAVIAAYTAAAPGSEALVWSLATFGLGCALLVAGQAVREMSGQRGVAALAALCLWGMPGTVGFMVRGVLVFPTESAFAVPLFAVVTLSEVLLVAALWQSVQHDTPAPDTNIMASWFVKGRVILVVVLLAVPLVVFGIFPRTLAVLAGWQSQADFPGFLGTLGSARRSVWIGLMISSALGVALGMFRERLLGQMRGWQAGIASIASLEWLYKGVTAGFRLAAGGLQYFATLGEGEGYLGWLALAGLIVLVLLRG